MNNRKLKEIYSLIHCTVNELFSFMNHKNRPGSGGHFNAEPSRDLIDIIDQIRVIKATLKDKYDFEVEENYDQIMKECRTFLSTSGGSSIPNDFPLIDIIEHKAIFTPVDSTSFTVNAVQTKVSIRLIGEGSYAKVFKYKDPIYKQFFAIKRAKKHLSSDEIERFRNEYEHLKSLESPFIIKAYNYYHEKNEYSMEFASMTLAEFIEKNNSKISFDARRSLVIQLLKAFEYIHSKGLLHRDISYHNVVTARIKCTVFA